MRKNGIITLTTDFGTTDAYTGAMKGAILGINPDARLVDITHDVPAGDILDGAFVLAGATPYFPKDTIHLAVVDPGVGGERKPILIETENYIFVGPDNGLLLPAAEVDRIKRVIILSNEKYILHEISSTFHGRDIFGPAAAHLSLGVDPSTFGEELKKYVIPEIPAPEVKNRHIHGQVVHADSFGNLITNITRYDILKNLPDITDGEIEVSIKGSYIKGISRTYSFVEPGGIAALIGSSGAVEVAVNGGSAANTLGAGVGEAVTIRVKEEGGEG